MIIQGDNLPKELMNTGTPYEYVPSNTTIAVAVDGSRVPFWQFDTGTAPDFNVALSNPVPPAYISTGIQAFESMNITYNTVSGRLIFTNAKLNLPVERHNT